MILLGSNDPAENAQFETCIAFLNGIGIETKFQPVEPNSFLPGLSIENGVILIDLELLQHPGDVLHEAGHIAVVPAMQRSKLDATAIINRKDREAEEIMAIAWSYAACMYLDIDPLFVFHEEGYRAGGDFIMESCDDKTYMGLTMLQGLGMTADDKTARRLRIPTYPHMIKWLRN